mmetsp:Transcript_5766/g.11358  ORF Transcript_5766/g.11358 Transcript_5766/m.11358 type:complete len:267 (+) Transcript_5766:230-1030(+)
MVELVRAALCVQADEQHVLLLVEVHRARHARAATARAPDRHERHILGAGVLIAAHVAVLHEEHAVAERDVRRPFSLEFEDDHAAIMPRGEEVGVGVRAEDPEAVVLAAEGLHTLPLGHVPHADRLVLRVGDDELLLRVEERARDVVDVAAEGVNLPRLGLVHPPQLHLPVVRARDDQRQRVVESRPVDAAVMPLKHILDRGVIAAKQVLHLDVGHGLAQLARHAVRLDRRTRRRRRRLLLGCHRVGQSLLAQTGDVPHTHCLVERG